MATRGTIRDAFLDHLTTEAAGTYDVLDADGNVDHTVTVDAQHVSLYNPNEENLPQIIYDDSYREIEYNGVGQAPDSTTYNNDGSVDREYWYEYREGQFTIDVRGSAEADVEPIYEAVHRAFQQFRYGPWNASDLHPDIAEIEVRSAISSDVPAADDVIRGDQVEVYITFVRDYHLESGTDVGNIDQVEHLVDADDDGTTDDTYITD